MGFQHWRLVVLRGKEHERQVQTVYKCLRQLSNRNTNVAFHTWIIHTKWHRKADRNTKKIMKKREYIHRVVLYRGKVYYRVCVHARLC